MAIDNIYCIREHVVDTDYKIIAVCKDAVDGYEDGNYYKYSIHDSHLPIVALRSVTSGRMGEERPPAAFGGKCNESPDCIGAVRL